MRKISIFIQYFSAYQLSKSLKSYKVCVYEKEKKKKRKNYRLNKITMQTVYTYTKSVHAMDSFHARWEKKKMLHSKDGWDYFQQKNILTH